MVYALNMIYTLDWIETQSHKITDYWNGNDAKFIDGNGDERTSDEAEAAFELLYKLDEIRQIIKYIKI